MPRARKATPAPSAVSERHRQVLRVLVIEDGRAAAAEQDHDLGHDFLGHNLVGREPGRGGLPRFDCQTVQDVSHALESVMSRPPDVVLLDLTFADSGGIESVERFCQAGHGVPVVVLADVEDEALGLAAVANGAADYLIKGPHGCPGLPRRLCQAFERASQSRRLAHLDSLALMGRVATGIAHELGNPTAFVRLNELSLEKLLTSLHARAPEELRAGLGEALEIVADNLEGLRRMNGLLRDMTRFTSREEPACERVELHDVASEVCRLVSRQLGAGVTLALDVERPCPVLAEARRIHQVLANLIVNAKDALGDAGGAISIRGYRQRDEVVLEVADSGNGISEENRARIFEPFFTTKGRLGTGLGLSLSAEIVRQHGGRLTVKPNMPRGSVFSMRLPHADVAEAQAHAPRRLAKVLVIDDDPMVRTACMRALSIHSQAYGAGGVTEGLAAIEATDFDLILCDVMMPELDGIDFYSAIRRDHPELLPRLVFFTGGTTEETVRRFLKQVPTRVLFKPVDTGLLEAMVRDAVAARS